MRSACRWSGDVDRVRAGTVGRARSSRPSERARSSSPRSKRSPPRCPRRRRPGVVVVRVVRRRRAGRDRVLRHRDAAVAGDVAGEIRRVCAQRQRAVAERRDVQAAESDRPRAVRPALVAMTLLPPFEIVSFTMSVVERAGRERDRDGQARRVGSVDVGVARAAAVRERHGGRRARRRCVGRRGDGRAVEARQQACRS